MRPWSVPLKSFLARQLGRPRGWVAPITARLLNRGNAQQNTDCMNALELAPGFKVLDLGFGGGASFARLLAECPQGRVAGTEISEEMLARARSQWASAIAEGRLEVVECSAERLTFADGSYDRVMSVNTVYFWPDLQGGLEEVRRVLSPDGRFVTSVVPGAMLARLGFEGEGFRVEDPPFYAEALRDAGFVDVRERPTGDAKGSVLISGVRAATPA